MSAPCLAGYDWSQRVAYERGELDPELEARFEAHLFECDVCASELSVIARLGRAVADAVAAGRVGVSARLTYVDALARAGQRLRTYRIEPGGTVACTAGPEDDYIVVRLALGADRSAALGVEHVDIDIETERAGADRSEAQRRDGVPLDRASGEIVMVFPADEIRAMPRARWTLRVHADAVALGTYGLDHTPWEELEPPPAG